jgi:SulP family sulfate permease
LYWTLDPSICRTCKTRIFKECNRGILPDGFRRLRLMLATDGSEFSHAPEEVAIALAKSFGVTLDLMTCVESADDDEIARVRLSQAERKALVAGVDSEQTIRHGKNPIEQVVSAAKSADTNILVIGRRPSRGGVKEVLVGDIAQQILIGSPCHVLVANWQTQPWQKRILMATDGTRISVTVTEMTAQIAKASRLPVTVLVAVPNPADRAKAEEDLAEKLGLLRVEGIECTSAIVEKMPEQAIIETTREVGADLVVIGNDQKKGLSRKLTGQLTDRIVGGLSCAVLVVKRPPEPDELVAAVRNQA